MCLLLLHTGNVAVLHLSQSVFSTFKHNDGEILCRREMKYCFFSVMSANTHTHTGIFLFQRSKENIYFERILIKLL